MWLLLNSQQVQLHCFLKPPPKQLPGAFVNHHLEKKGKDHTRFESQSFQSVVLNYIYITVQNSPFRLNKSACVPAATIFFTSERALMLDNGLPCPWSSFPLHFMLVFMFAPSHWETNGINTGSFWPSWWVVLKWATLKLQVGKIKIIVIISSPLVIIGVCPMARFNRSSLPHLSCCSHLKGE